MNPLLTRHRRKLLWLLTLIALFLLYRADFWKAERFKQQTRLALEQALGRKVVINGEASYSWRTFPGITVEDVIIHEDPRHGREPMMYASAIQTRIRVLSLLSGKLALDLVRLDAPSVNLSRTAAGVNMNPFLERLLPRKSSQPLPDITIANGRINFVSDRRKSVLYLSNADLALIPLDDRSFRVQFEGEPARTDRKAVGFGRFRTTGLLRLGEGGRESTADLTFELDNSNIAEVAALFEPKAVSLSGKISSKATLKGTFSDATLQGSVTFSPSRPTLNPLKAASIPLRYTGRVNFKEQLLALDATRDDNKDLGVTARFRAREILQRPHWAALASFHDVPSAPVFSLARDLALVDVDPALLNGNFSGALSLVDGLPQGGALLDTKDPKQEWLAGVVVQGPSVDLALDLRATPVTALKPFLAKTFPDSLPPVLAHLEDGTLTGAVRVRRQADAVATWSGSLRLTNAKLALPLLAEPWIGSALAEFDADRLVVSAVNGRFLAARMEVQGNYRYEPNRARPHRFQWATPAADASALERLLAPALRSAAAAEWLPKLQAEGSLRIGEFLLAGVPLKPTRANIVWDGRQILLTGLESGPARGILRVQLGAPQPVYHYEGAAQNVPWKSGQMDLRLTFDCAGTGASLLNTARISGAWGARGFKITPEQEVRQASGTLTGGPPPLRLANVQLLLGSESYTGEGTVETGGKWSAQLASGTRQLRLAGEIWPFTLESRP